MNVADLPGIARPPGAVDATFPLEDGVKYRTFWNPTKSHYAMPGTDHSYCGLGLCIPEDERWWIESGWEQVGWFIIENRTADNLCGECADKRGKDYGRHEQRRADPAVVAAVRVQTEAEVQRMDRIAKTVLSWFGEGAELVA